MPSTATPLARSSSEIVASVVDGGDVGAARREAVDATTIPGAEHHSPASSVRAVRPELRRRRRRRAGRGRRRRVGADGVRQPARPLPAAARAATTMATSAGPELTASLQHEAAGHGPGGATSPTRPSTVPGRSASVTGTPLEAVVGGQRRDDAGGWLLGAGRRHRHPRHGPDAEHHLEEVVVVRPALPQAGVAGAGAGSTASASSTARAHRHAPRPPPGRRGRPRSRQRDAVRVGARRAPPAGRCAAARPTTRGCRRRRGHRARSSAGWPNTTAATTLPARGDQRRHRPGGAHARVPVAAATGGGPAPVAGIGADGGRGGRWSGTVQRPREAGSGRRATRWSSGAASSAWWAPMRHREPGGGAATGHERLHPPALGADVDEAVVGRHPGIAAAHVGVASPADHRRAGASATDRPASTPPVQRRTAAARCGGRLGWRRTVTTEPRRSPEVTSGCRRRHLAPSMVTGAVRPPERGRQVVHRGRRVAQAHRHVAPGAVVAHDHHVDRLDVVHGRWCVPPAGPIGSR